MKSGLLVIVENLLVNKSLFIVEIHGSLLGATETEDVGQLINFQTIFLFHFFSVVLFSA